MSESFENRESSIEELRQRLYVLAEHYALRKQWWHFRFRRGAMEQLEAEEASLPLGYVTPIRKLLRV